MENNARNLFGKTLGTCTLESLIGQGGMGAVYLARQIRPSRYVAVKILLPMVITDSQTNKEFLARFRQEADVIARLDHINIMPIFEYGELDGLAYLVMPHLPGGSLRDVLVQKGALSLQDAAQYINQAAAALDYAHTHGVIHRDLKPGNFLLHNDGRLVLADFGIARTIQESDSTVRATLTRTGMLLGTPEYMAPEMVLGEQIDSRADIYALGIVLFQMLSGHVPFQGNTPFAVANKQLQEPIPLLHEVNPTIPPAVDALIQKALAKRREDRYTSAGAMAQDLHNTISAPHFFSENELRNAPTVLSLNRAKTPPVVISSNEGKTPPPTFPVIQRPQTNSSQPAIVSGNSTRGQFPHNELTAPVTPYATSPAYNRQQPFLIFIGVLLMLILVVGGIIVGLQLNKGTVNTNLANPVNGTPAINSTVHTQITPTSQSSPESTPTTQATPTQSTSIPKGTTLYSVTTPGRPCDSTGGHWANFNSPTITCQGSGTLISNPYPQSPNLVGTLLTAMPNGSFPSNYVIEANLQQMGTAADFGIYFRNQPGDNQNGIYTFFIHPNGTWSAYVYDNLTGAPSEIARGSLNGASGNGTLDVVVSGPNFTFYVNGHQVGKANDSTYPSGTVGIAVDAGGTILASNFVLYAISTQ